jgi:outer membrane protein assembly factor BamB
LIVGSLVTSVSGSAAAAVGVVALGTQAIAPSVDTNSAGVAEAFQTTAAATGSIGSLSLYIDSSSKATSAIVGVYTDNGGAPRTLLTQGSITSPVNGSWNTVNVPAAPVSAGTAYWISVLAPAGAGILHFRDTAGGTTSLNSSQTTLTSLPSAWSSGSHWADSPVSAYATLAVTGPSLSVTPLAIDMETPVGSNPVAVPVTIANTGIGTLDYTTSSDASWLSVSPASGVAPQTLSLIPATSSLTTGTYTAHVTVSAAGVSDFPQVVTVTLAVEPASGATAADWPTVDHDLSRSGTGPAEGAIGVGNVASLAPAWSDTLDGKVSAQPLYLGSLQIAGATHDVVIAATNKDTLYALDADSGATLWSDHLTTATSNCSVPGGLGITSTPVVDRAAGRVYAVTDDGDLRVLSLSTGAQVTSPLPVVTVPKTNNVWGGLTLFDGNLYIPTGSTGCDQAPWPGGIYQVGVAGATPT